MSRRRPDNPPPLVVAASLVALQGGLLLMLGLVEMGSLSSARLAMGLTTAAFFLIYGAALLLCSWSVTRGHGWARGPIILTQLLSLGLAWSFRGGGTTWVAILLAVVAGIVLAGILHPASMQALADDRRG